MSWRVEKAAPVETVNSLSWGGWDWLGATSLRPREPSDILAGVSQLENICCYGLCKW